MVNYQRSLQKNIEELIGSNKVIIITGTRRVGKTVLINAIKEKYPGKYLSLNGEDFDVHELLKNRSVANYTRLIGDATLLLIDEAQAIPDIGMVMKLMIDSIPSLTIIATGSSSLDIMNKSGAPLTGRQYETSMYPLAQLEITQHETLLQTNQNLDERLIFGSYPEVLNLKTIAQKTTYLSQLVQSYLLKDILAYDGIRHSEKIYSLLRLIARQSGSEVSYTELGNKLSMSKNTVESYLDLLSKVFIIYKVGAYGNNQRKEISKGVKWYFFDNGIRNAIINDFRLPPLRDDMGILWENYLLYERIKRNTYKGIDAQYYFWRTYDQQEIDLIEYSNGQASAFEFKLSPNAKGKLPEFFAKTYPDVPFTKISRDNYLDWVL